MGKEGRGSGKQEGIWGRGRGRRGERGKRERENGGGIDWQYIKIETH
jgi:hypothetical protein